MQIWIDGQAFQSPSRFRGIGRYIIELLKAIKKNHSDIELMMSFNAAMPNDVCIARNLVKDIIPARNIFLWEGVKTDGEGVEGYTDRIKLNEQMLAYHVACLKPDLALSTSPFEGGNNLCVPLTSSYDHNYPIAGIFYDAIPYRYPELYLANEIAFNYYCRRLFCHRNFDLNLSISDFSHSEIVSILDKNNSVPIYAGLSDHFLNLQESMHGESSLKALGVSGDYLLYVGELDWRKNYLLIADALNYCSTEQAKSLQLIIAGGRYQPGIDKLKERWEENGLNPKKLIFLGHVTDEELVALNKSAFALIQPSLMEGFGLTALEGIACQTPVLVANAGALPEVVNCEEATFDPHSPEELSHLIDKLIEGRGFRKELVSKCHSNLARYSWDRSAELAVEAMRVTAKKFEEKNQHKNDSKSIALENARKLNLNKTVVAHGFSRATPKQADSKSGTLVDVSSTSLIDHRTGIQRVVYSISKSLLENESSNQISLISCNEPGGFKKASIKKDGKFKIQKRDKSVNLNKATRLLMLDGSWDYLRLHKQSLMDFHLRGGEIIYVLYDLVPFRAPAYCLEGVPEVYNNWFSEALELVDGFVCISKAVADNLIKVLEGIEFSRPLKVSYWTLGADLLDLEVSVPPDSMKKGVIKSNNKFLMVGTIEPRKGYDFAIKAFNELWDSGFEHELTIIGKQGWSSQEVVKSIEGHNQFGKRLFWINNASDEDIAEYYQKSDALISTSHIEGFGLPIVESSYFQCPAIVPDIPVFRGIANADSTLFFNPESPKFLAKKLMSFNENKKDLYNALKESKKKTTSWSESANQLIRELDRENWYNDYAPNSKLRNGGEIAVFNTKNGFDQDEVSFEISQISDPEVANDDRFYKCTIKVIYRGKEVLSSKGPAMNAHFGIFLGTRIMQEDGTLVDYPGNRTSIPLVMVPDLAYYLSIKLEKTALEQGKPFQVQFLQESHMWFSNSIIVTK